MRERLRQYLQNQGLTPNRAEEKCGFPTGTLQKYLSGKNMGSDKIEKVGEVFSDLNVHWWITGEGDMLLSLSSAISDPGHLEDPKNSFIKWMTNIERDLTSIKKQVTNLAIQSNK